MSDRLQDNTNAARISRLQDIDSSWGSDSSWQSVVEVVTPGEFGWKMAGPVGGPIKRIMDVLLASAAIVLLMPVFVTIAALVWLTEGRPIVFRQERVGYAGRRFKCYKFRTMVLQAEAALETYLQQNPDAEVEWRSTRKLKRDPRVTGLGFFLRKSSLDELPQLWNVLKGDMSFVGPRPVPADELANYGPNADCYLTVRPGLTGIWQISGRNALGYRRRVELDVAYARTWSIWLDIKIIFATIPALARSHQTS